MTIKKEISLHLVTSSSLPSYQMSSFDDNLWWSFHIHVQNIARCTSEKDYIEKVLEGHEEKFIGQWREGDTYNKLVKNLA